MLLNFPHYFCSTSSFFIHITPSIISDLFSLSLSLPLSLSLSLSIYLSIYLSIFLPLPLAHTHSPSHLSLSLCINIYTCIFISLSLSLFYISVSRLKHILLYFSLRFLDIILRQKRISESSTQQLLLDTYNMKTLLLLLHTLEGPGGSTGKKYR